MFYHVVTYYIIRDFLNFILGCFNIQTLCWLWPDHMSFTILSSSKIQVVHKNVCNIACNNCLFRVCISGKRGVTTDSSSNVKLYTCI